MTGTRRWPFAAAAAVLGAGALAGRADAADVFSVDVVLAPAALDGSFEITIDTGDVPVRGTLDVDQDVRGRVVGTLQVDATTFAVTGKVRHGRKGTHAAFVATSGADRIAFGGKLTGQTLGGLAKAKGAVAAGRHDFVVNLANAPALTARVACSVTPGTRGRLTGSAHVDALGESMPLTVGGRGTARRWSVVLRAGKVFRFSGAGAPAETPVLAWSAKGFGATAKGTGLVFATLDPPSPVTYAAASYELETEASIAPIVPAGGTGADVVFSIDPALPAGLSFDADDGSISGLPTELRLSATYTVTAQNFAGASQDTFDLFTRIPRAKSFAAETRALSDEDVRHLLARTQFGVTDAAFDRVRTLGLDGFVDDMLLFAQNGPAEAIAAPELVNATDPVGLEGMFPSQTQLARWWSSLMMNTDNPFQERLAFFWHDLFSASSDVTDGGQTHFVKGYVNLFRYHGHENLRPLLVSMARDPLMLIYLDGYRNTRTAPNENFAREFWELFTLGVDNGYTQEDIVEAARAFTGYQLVTDPNTGLSSMNFNVNRHDAGAKTFLGATIPGQSATDDYQAVADVTLANGDVAEYVTRKLFEHFAYANPPQELVDAMAADLRASNYDLADFLKGLFRSEAFFSGAARKSLVKNPVDFAMGFIHTTGLKITVNSVTNQLSTLGQVATQPPSVNGWPQGDLWLSAQNMTDRMNAVYLCVEDTTRQMGLVPQINIADILPPVAERTPENVVDTIAKLLRLDLTAEERQRGIDFLNTAVSGTASNPVATASPFEGANQSHLDTRVRGLLYVYAQHPSYQLR